MDKLFEGVWGDWFRRGVVVTVVLLAVFVGLKALAELQGLRYIGAGLPPANTIDVTGYGETFATPDIATFTYSVVALKLTVAAAQEDAAEKSNAIVKYLRDSGIAEKDIQTSNYSVYPQYEYSQVQCLSYPCPGGRQVLKGYEVRQSTTVKIRDTAKAGDLLTGAGSRGATEVSGLQFTFDDPHAGQTQAREKAIADAKAQAEVLSKQLGVRLVRVVSFSESGSQPVYKLQDAYGRGGAESSVTPAPDISVGENKITSNVSITYEIK
ncbi:hypothetical protein A2852_00720 [Candidatus Adlerbacteria bacterium RIFCSPHIGHO2_01_FULL_54_23]|uniref:DUF541 domain-containing protein n=3 Tax=Candidatus Adleribacteriota TaxID=1752736 RepID=A0A1F4Y045_9BACT|nr:MAG: hypothetical protein UY83_C0003G0113 [Candidatus Adlerbacteria bacterium GW2011_GWA1_54_10]KKW36289.1 MAG: hypothetical protein UY84_C0001G0177 [Candidatus Adlerbacteria bacterium GW2011_GWA2_54_12]KKW37819.1 MAG: hypothetical protein UY86_C0003G0041 [Candidatus Adlerbacteria bacterium GW2011_GWB1_54_7]OGC78850.1 MAG: hypothetical protein A2852_00720 [Candidatus Adlerbacteria bacterium RIFCSPHIGHO2_01_FULL_54_23]OGC87228.1 MAG: hypothetical protein A3B33_02645 [Candidatus Adlerbacteria 